MVHGNRRYSTNPNHIQQNNVDAYDSLKENSFII